MKAIIMCFLFLTSVIYVHAQGCSDAGLCTIDALKPVASSTQMQKSSKVSGGFSVGGADYGITVVGGNLGYSGRLTEKWSVDSRVTFLSQSGNDIGVTGPGDVFLNINYTVSQKFILTAGTKIPLAKAGKKFDGLPLPMDYQSSLGTFDLVAGIKFKPKRWQWALAVQVPLKQNENAFFPELYDTTSIVSTIQATNGFHRQADILLRVSRTFEMSEKITFTPGLLPIYHVAEDTYTDIDGLIKNIEGSDGLTLNGTVFIDIKLDAVSTLEFSLGFPFIVRDARPDGLTRSFVFGAGYSAEF
jgi:hypothetical protein